MKKYLYYCRGLYKSEVYQCIETAVNEANARAGAAERWECAAKDIEIIKVKEMNNLINTDEEILVGLKKLTIEEIRARDGETVLVKTAKEKHKFPISKFVIKLDNGDVFLENSKGFCWTEFSIYSKNIEVWGKEQIPRIKESKQKKEDYFNDTFF